MKEVGFEYGIHVFHSLIAFELEHVSEDIMHTIAQPAPPLTKTVQLQKAAEAQKSINCRDGRQWGPYIQLWHRTGTNSVQLTWCSLLVKNITFKKVKGEMAREFHRQPFPHSATFQLFFSTKKIVSTMRRREKVLAKLTDKPVSPNWLCNYMHVRWKGCVSLQHDVYTHTHTHTHTYTQAAWQGLAKLF